MTDEKHTPVDNPPAETESAEDTTVSEQAAQPGAETTRTGQASRGGLVVGLVALVLSVLALGASAYLWYSVEVQQKLERTQTTANLTSDLKGLTQQLASLEKQQGKLEARQGEVDKAIKQTLKESIEPLKQTIEPLRKSQADLSSSMKELSSSVEKVYADLDRSLGSWALEEVEQLLRIAHHSVKLSRDPDTARAGLELADRRLQQLGNPKFTEVRRLIADEIAQLNAVKQPDLPGLTLRLNSMTKVVDKFPLKQQPQQDIAGGTKPAGGDQKDSDWIKAGREILADLKGLVRIQNVAEPAQALLSPEERYYLFENLRLMLSGAQIALLKGDTTTYRGNLEQAENWLQNYFNTEDPAVEQTLTDLQQMRNVELRPELPDVSGSLSTFQKIKLQAEAQ